MTYAIIEASGKQICIEKDRFYDLNKIQGEPGDIIQLNRILLVNQNGNVRIGKPCVEGIVVRAKILKHVRGRKVTVFKMKPKKNSRSKQGHRQDLTRILILDIR